jgi:hypothetical protein
MDVTDVVHYSMSLYLSRLQSQPNQHYQHYVDIAQLSPLIWMLEQKEPPCTPVSRRKRKLGEGNNTI